MEAGGGGGRSFTADDDLDVLQTSVNSSTTPSTSSGFACTAESLRTTSGIRGCTPWRRSALDMKAHVKRPPGSLPRSLDLALPSTLASTPRCRQSFLDIAACWGSPGLCNSIPMLLYMIVDMNCAVSSAPPARRSRPHKASTANNAM